MRFGARLKAFRHQADFWHHATLVELAVLAEDADSAFGFLAHAFAAGPLPWQARSLLDTLERLRRVRERTRPSPEWLHEIEAELARVATAPSADAR